MSDAMTQAREWLFKRFGLTDASFSGQFKVTLLFPEDVNALAALLAETRTKALEEAAECADRELSNGIDDYKSHTGKAIRRLAAEGGEI
jgi:predicted transcriptional regulator